ncbi:MAG: PP2C family protein-serine/threonine phosphatase, partial [Acidimicrobiales bacterium]|nr:PP2C family protein-serine/threonine phosphatase [Acidimicrobiales bacterium]
NPSIESMGVRAWAGHPIRDARGLVLGTMCAVDVETRDWSVDDDDLLRLLAESAGNVIQLRAELDRTEEHALDMRRSLLPPMIEVVPSVDVAALHRSAGGRGAVMGDFYDVFRSIRDRWHVVIGDVCGRGTEAAKFTSLVRWTYQASADHKDDPGEILCTVNDVLRRQPDARFVTGQALTFDEQTGSTMHARFASAGHHPALIRRADGTVEPVVENGWMLGMFEPYEIRSVDVTLEQGDLLVMFTDGVIEARRGDDLLGAEAVEEALADFSGDAYELTQRLVDLADAFADDTDDDIAVVAVAPRGPDEATS